MWTFFTRKSISNYKFIFFLHILSFYFTSSHIYNIFTLIVMPTDSQVKQKGCWEWTGPTTYAAKVCLDLENISMDLKSKMKSVIHKVL